MSKIWKDEGEVIRKFVNEQYVKLKRVAAVGSLVLLGVNLSLSVYPYVSHRFPEYLFGIVPSTWIAIPVVFIVLMTLLWLCAHIYVKKMEMYRTEFRAEMMFNPYAVYALRPWEEMYFSHTFLPIMETLIELSKGEQKEKLEKNIKKFKNWLELGYIPKKDFPKHLKKFYITKKEQRL